MAGHLTLILGGARGGKSRYALERAAALGERVLFVATAQALDDDMRERVARHQAERPQTWATLEAPLDVARPLRSAMVGCDVIVVDCVTLLASNVLLSQHNEATQDEVDAALIAEIDALLALRDDSPAHWILVSNEVGMGIVPATRLGRLFRDALGRANQRVAAAADEVLLIVAGLPWRLKGREGGGDN